MSHEPTKKVRNPDVGGRWEQRWHPLRQEWVVYSAHRNARPWLGSTEAAQAATPPYDPNCYLCPGNPRVHGKRNPKYSQVYIFDNDHPVVGPDAPEVSAAPVASPLFRVRTASGLARVVCYDPRHNVTLTDMPLAKVVQVFVALREQMHELRKRPEVNFALIFENKGEIVGVSNPHPHCQIYATNFVFKHIATELGAANQYRQEHHADLFADLISLEQSSGVRLIAENELALGFVPYFARYAYEVWIFPKKKHATLITMTDEELRAVASVFQEVTRRYDLLFGISFPYVMTFYQSPIDGNAYDEYHLHLILMPPLRQPGIRKFLAGPEIGGGNFMADTMPEAKAAELKNVDLSRFREST